MKDTDLQTQIAAFITAIGSFIGAVAVLVASSIFRGYVLTILWGWFVVTEFGLPQVSIAMAIGLALVARYLTHIPRKDDRKFPERLAQAFINPLVALAIGWIAHRYV